MTQTKPNATSDFNYLSLPRKDLVSLLLEINKVGFWLGTRPVTILCILLVFFGLTAVYGMTFEEGIPTEFAELIAPPIIFANLAGTIASPFTQLFARMQGRNAQWGFLLAAAVAVVVAMVSLFVDYFMNWSAEILFSATEAFFLTSFAATAAVFTICFCHGKELDKKIDDVFVKYDLLILEQLQPIQSRLPAAKRGKVLSICINKKLLTVKTETGLHVIRLSIKEALIEMDHDEGLMLNRATWVRVSEIEALERERESDCAT